MTAVSLSSKPERFAQPEPGASVWDWRALYEVEHVCYHDGGLFFKFHGIDSISDAETLRGAEVQVPSPSASRSNPASTSIPTSIGCEVRDRASGTRGRHA